MCHQGVSRELCGGALITNTDVFEPTGAVEPPMTISAFAYNEALEEYTLTPLEAGIVYELAPIGWEGLENINLHFACKGGSVRVFPRMKRYSFPWGMVVYFEIIEKPATMAMNWIIRWSPWN